jgi:signal transduction histidine kinase
MERSDTLTATPLAAATLVDAPEALTLEDACAALFASLAPYAGAVAAAFVQCEPAQVLAVWNCEPGDVRRVLSGPCLAGRPETLSELVLPLAADHFAAAHGQAADGVRAIPMRPADGRSILLLLFYSQDVVPDAVQLAHGSSMAALGTVLLEREFYAEEARRAREARDHFLVAIHHELRTPATAVMLEAGLLHSGLLGSLPPRLQNSLSRLESQIGELVRVVQRVLDLAKLETSIEPARDDLVDPRETVVALARHVEPAAERKSVTLSLFFPRALPIIQTDAERFRRVLLYLLANAIKYTERGKIQVRVERMTRKLTEHRREPLLVVRVVDTGRGIPREELERIFQPFAQVEEGARTDSFTRGVGLGLPLARKLARSLGGDVEVESEPGQGTTATFSVPYRAATPG